MKSALLVAGAVLALTLSESTSAARSRFEPVSFTAVSEHDYWLLGTVPCGSRRCYTILATHDDGRTFTPVRAPRLPTEGSTPELRFADRRDGFAFALWTGTFYATHDGGASWRRLHLGQVTGFATGGGNAYVATTRSFLRSPVSANAWRSQPLPFASQGAPLTVAAHGLHLWLLVMPRAKAPRFDLLARSRDGGTTFTTGRGPCYPGLGGDLEPTSASTIWAVCPTGMLAGASRSTDGGVTFDVLHTPTLINATMLAPASNATAVLAPNPQSQLLRTTDGGRSWKRVHTPERSINMPWVGFTDARVGAALVEVSPTRTVFWRTHDGGARWSEVNLP